MRVSCQDTRNQMVPNVLDTLATILGLKPLPNLVCFVVVTDYLIKKLSDSLGVV